MKLAKMKNLNTMRINNFKELQDELYVCGFSPSPSPSPRPKPAPTNTHSYDCLDDIDEDLSDIDDDDEMTRRRRQEGEAPSHSGSKGQSTFASSASASLSEPLATFSLSSERTLRGGKYKVLKVVGHGTFGEVLQCEVISGERGREIDSGIGIDNNNEVSIDSSSSSSSSVVAVKRVFLQKNVRSTESCYANTLEHAIREVKTLERVHSEHVVKVFEHWVDEQQFVLSMALEYCLTDLRQLMLSEVAQRELQLDLDVVEEDWDRGRCSSLSIVKYIMLQLLEGLRACHTSGVIHRDIKPSNCLLNHKGQVKLGDFGQATMDVAGQEGNLTHAVSTRWYRAPEILYGSRSYDEKVDIWSLGCTFAELVSKPLGSALICGESDIDQMAKCFRTFGTPKETNWPGVSQLPDYGKIIFDDFEPTPLCKLFPYASESLLDLFGSIFQLNPRRRASAESLIEHPFFQEEPKPAAPERLTELCIRVKAKNLLHSKANTPR